mgnify:CR=1 FL=1
MAKKYTKRAKSAPKKEQKKKQVRKAKKAITKTPKSELQKKENHHKFLLIGCLEFKDVLSKVIPLKGGKFGALSENGEFLIFEVKDKGFKCELSFEVPGANLFCQLGNGILVFNSFNFITFWELAGKNMNKISEHETSFSLVTYFMEPVNENICAISGPSDTIEIFKFNKTKKVNVTYLNYEKSKLKNKKSKKKDPLLEGAEGIGSIYYQKKHSRLLATHFSKILRVWNCDFEHNKYELFKEVEYVMSFTGKIIHELNNKILIGGENVITILDNNNYEIVDLVDFGNLGYDIFSMEVIKYYNFKEFVVCGLRNGRILGVDIAQKKIEFNKTKINNTGKDNELNIKDGKISFYGENISYISKVGNKNMILASSHDHTLKLIEY